MKLFVVRHGETDWNVKELACGVSESMLTEKGRLQAQSVATRLKEDKEKKAIELLEMVDLPADFIHKYPQNMSGGQKQRIGIARALYSNPEVLVFDEATSALDSETETAVMSSINSLHGKKTMIIIAHRLNTIKDANKIIVMDDGKIIESGNHEKLMNDKGTYYSMFSAMEKAKEFSI